MACETLNPQKIVDTVSRLQSRIGDRFRQDLSALPFAMIWQTCLFLAPMLFIIHNWQGFAGTCAIGIGAFVEFWFIWFRHQPKGNFYD